MKSFAILSSFVLLGLSGAIQSTSRSLATCPTTGIMDTSGTFCCPSTCGTCGGTGCNLRPGGASNCCTSQIKVSCDIQGLPCIASTSTTAPTTTTSSCPTGTIADSSGSKCCASTCGTCGGYGCHLRPGGAAACCTSTVTASCTTNVLPCVIYPSTSAPTVAVTVATTTATTSACPTGSIPDGSGLKCCASTCGSCGGFGCNLRPGGATACCTSSVSTSCSTGTLPCLVDQTSTTTCPTGSVTDESGTMCCDDACGACGGYGCHLFPGGAAACCTSSITALC